MKLHTATTLILAISFSTHTQHTMGRDIGILIHEKIEKIGDKKPFARYVDFAALQRKFAHLGKEQETLAPNQSNTLRAFFYIFCVCCLIAQKLQNHGLSTHIVP